MGVTPTPVNNIANDINKVIQIAIYDVAINALQAYARVQLPWLNWPVISQIFNLIVNKLGGLFYTYLSQLVTFEVIDMQTDEEKSAYMQALTALQSAITAGDQNAITQATTSVKTSLASLIHWDGSSTSMHLKLIARLRKS